LSTERSLHYYISDPRSKFQEDRTKIVVAIVDETFCGHTHKHTHRQTHTRTNTQVILYLSNAMNCIGQTITLLLTQKVVAGKVHCTLYCSDFISVQCDNVLSHYSLSCFGVICMFS